MDGGLSFFCRLELASHFTLRICIKKLVNQTAGCVLCRYSKRYLVRKSKAPAVSPPKLPYPWKCPQPPIKFLPRLPISTFSLCCDTHGSRAPILKDQAQTTLPKMKMLNFENQVMMVTFKNQAHSCLCYRDSVFLHVFVIVFVFSVFTMSSIIFPQTFRLLPTFDVSVTFSGLFLTKVGGGGPNAHKYLGPQQSMGYLLHPLTL